jgi:hypothetical protein
MSVSLAKTESTIIASRVQANWNARLRDNDLVALARKFSGK